VLAEWPVARPLSGSVLELATPVRRLAEGRAVVISGLPAYVSLDPGEYDAWLDQGAGAIVEVRRDDVFRVVKLEKLWGSYVAWHLDDGTGGGGKVVANADSFALAPPPADEVPQIERARVGPAPDEGDLQTTLHLEGSLQHVYDPRTVRVAANVARATHGESRREPLGAGDASQSFQRYVLRDAPITYTQSSGSTGAVSTLVVRVNGVRWHEVRALYGRGPRERVYVVRAGEDGKTSIEFGDGTTGARLPTGAQNLRADYRVGTGLAGQVDRGRLTTPMGVPLGVKAVTNPFPATGGADPESIDRARRNAPLTVKTFERIVSLQDVEDFALAFAGIGKAQATRLWDGETDVVHVTVAADDGTTPEPDSPTLANLRTACRDAGDPHLRMQIDGYVAAPFAVEATVVVDADHEAATVLDAVRAALADTFSFERRAFAQSVAESDVVATMQRVEGVVGVELEWLHLVGEYTLLPAERARFFAGSIIPAQLLTLAADQITVTAA
jgi:predicted phage baseplate assembly protein